LVSSVPAKIILFASTMFSSFTEASITAFYSLSYTRSFATISGLARDDSILWELFFGLPQRLHSHHRRVTGLRRSETSTYSTADSARKKLSCCHDECSRNECSLRIYLRNKDQFVEMGSRTLTSSGPSSRPATDRCSRQ
jgi:hypothetical protein